jgi:hypothetical protein
LAAGRAAKVVAATAAERMAVLRMRFISVSFAPVPTAVGRRKNRKYAPASERRLNAT